MLPTIVIWAVLMMLSVPALLLLGSPQAMRSPRVALDTLGLLPRWRAEQERNRREALEKARFADEVRVAAIRAQDAAQRWELHWQQAEEESGKAWQSWQMAEQRVRRVRAGAAWSVPENGRKPQEYADRERFLHRAVKAAAERGDLPAATLADVYTGRGGWDPRLHPAQQELVVLRAIARHREWVFQQAAAAERSAWHDAQLAGSARASLRREAADAAEKAAAVRRHLPSRREPRPSPMAARRLRPVMA
ncbi:hypothetical protein [Actinoplanes sp. HUAS TT8]|uniref:hypothetical protein n=1 Tax=Actinoplanes sp. HUAS TT8 TaxID=3447453 RepID=UPI003F51FFC2